MCGCSSKDLLMKVIAQGLSPESTTMDKVHSPLRVNTLDMDLNIHGTQSIQVTGLLEWYILRSEAVGVGVQVMTPNPECAGLDTTLVDALHIMHDGKFLHLPVVDQGMHVSCTLLNFLIQV
jgi:CBS domain-containing protein